MTLNPSLDYVVLPEPAFVPGALNRCGEGQILPGGKGINVSVCLAHFGCDTRAFAMAGGFTGKEIERLTEAQGVPCRFIETEHGISRINVKIRGANGPETEINASGPAIRQEELQELTEALVTGLSAEGEHFLVLSGSVPKGLSKTVYADLMRACAHTGANVVADTSGEAFLAVLPLHPFLVKPNHHELGEIFGVTVETHEDAIRYGRELQKMGARNVLVSMGGLGAVLVTEDGRSMSCKALNGVVINTVGAGDSMVAGFLYGYGKRGDGDRMERAFAYGVCAGSASAFSYDLATLEEVESLLARENGKIVVRPI